MGNPAMGHPAMVHPAMDHPSAPVTAVDAATSSNLATVQAGGGKSKSTSVQSGSGDDQIPTKPIMPPFIQNPSATAPTLGSGSAANARVLTVEEAVTLAIANQPSLEAAAGKLQAARGALNAARSGLYPNLALTSSYAYQSRLGQLGMPGTTGGSGASGSSNGFDTVLQLRQLLFDFGRTAASVEEAKHTADAEAQLAAQDVSDLAFAVKRQYYAASLAAEQVRVDTADVKSQQDALNLAVARLKAGLGAPSDVVTAEANLNSSTSDLSEAQAAEVSAQVSLAALIGIDPTSPISVQEPSGDTNAGAPSIAETLKQALANRADMKAAREAVLAAQAAVKAAKLGLAPSVGLNLSATSRGTQDPFAQDQTSAGVTITVPIIDSGLNRGQIQEAQGSATQAAASLKSLELSVAQEAAQASIDLQSAVQKEKISEAGAANAQEAVRLAEGRYQAGFGVLLDVTTAQALLVKANTGLAEAKAALLTAHAEYEHAVGAAPVLVIQPMPARGAHEVQKH